MSSSPKSMDFNSSNVTRAAPNSSRTASKAVSLPGLLYRGFRPCHVPDHPPFRAFNECAVGPETKIFPALEIGSTLLSFLSSVKHSFAAWAGAASSALRSSDVNIAGSSPPLLSSNPKRSFIVKMRRTLRSIRFSEISPSSTNSLSKIGNSKSMGTMLMSMPARMAMRMASL